MWLRKKPSFAHGRCRPQRAPPACPCAPLSAGVWEELAQLADGVIGAGHGVTDGVWALKDLIIVAALRRQGRVGAEALVGLTPAGRRASKQAHPVQTPRHHRSGCSLSAGRVSPPVHTSHRHTGVLQLRGFPPGHRPAARTGGRSDF